MAVRLSRPGQAVVTAALIATLASVHLWTGANHRRALADGPDHPVDEAVFLAPIPVIRAMAIGRPSFAADVLWLRAISYFAVHFHGDKEYRWLDPLIDAITELDPSFRKVYHWASVVLMYGRAIDNDGVRASIRVLEKGVERFPYDWELHFILGCNYYFELRSEDPAQVNEWRRLGASHIESAANLPGAPSWLPLTVAGMRSRTGQKELAIRHLEEVYLNTDDEKLRETIGAELAEMKSEHAVESLTRERREFERAWKGSFPYMPPDLFVLVGERYSGRVAPVWMLPGEATVDDASEPQAPDEHGP